MLKNGDEHFKNPKPVSEYYGSSVWVAQKTAISHSDVMPHLL
jgi:hypothetical protein